MNEPQQVATYGSWRSPISAASVAAGAVPLEQPDVDDQNIYWVEGKPLEDGRAVIVRQSASGERRELTPSPFYVRTTVHEYGGGAYVAHGSTVFFSNFNCQRLYRQDDDHEPQPITPEPDRPGDLRYADARVTRNGRLLFCVREQHSSGGREAVNELAVIPTDGSAPPRTVVSGHDFFAAPRISPDGHRLTWLTWDHPRMPWDGTQLWLGDLAEDGTIANVRVVAGGPQESVIQPEWSPQGDLHFVSDRTGWWNLYRLADDNDEALAPMEAEFGAPTWYFGDSSYAFLDDGRIACIYSSEGIDHLAFVSPGERLVTADLPYTSYAPSLRAAGDSLVFIAGSPTEASAVVRMDIRSGEREVLRRSVENPIDSSYISRAQPITFPAGNGDKAHALYYPPTNPEFSGPDAERPPLIVKSHGGPTAMARAHLNTETQYWTSRGFAVVDVNYGGSSGYGRKYRNRLYEKWGIVDTADCINAAHYLADQGLVDGRRLTIRGGSAGGYTTLCALVFHDDFAAGASYYGVADCEALAKDTHKFESRYLDGLIGPYPETQERYRERSPIHFTDRLSCPVILFQGLEDKVVPPAQAEEMVEALRAKRLPVAYLPFPDEQHGFRKAENIQRTLEAELYFYSKVLKFPLTEQIPPLEIENL